MPFQSKAHFSHIPKLRGRDLGQELGQHLWRQQVAIPAISQQLIMGGGQAWDAKGGSVADAQGRSGGDQADLRI